jgi:hypothetical protein
MTVLRSAAGQISHFWRSCEKTRAPTVQMTHSGRHDRQDSAGMRLVTAVEDGPASSQAQQKPGKATTKVKLNLHGLHDLHNRA